MNRLDDCSTTLHDFKGWSTPSAWPDALPFGGLVPWAVLAKGRGSVISDLRRFRYQPDKKRSPIAASEHTERGSGGMRRLVVVLSSTQGVAQGSQSPQHESDQQHDHAVRPENFECEYKANNWENQSEDNHDVACLCSVSVSHAQLELPHCSRNLRHAFFTNVFEARGDFM
jgi:hypothetical protein